MFYALLIIAVIFRLVPHPANFVPIGAMTIYISRKHSPICGVVFAIVSMLISDLYLGFTYVSLYVYLGFAAYALCSKLIGKKIYGYLIAAVAGSAIFFIVSNFGVWTGSWYPHTVPGLLSCFVAAIPFYKNTISADVIFTILIFVGDYVYNKFAKNKLCEVLWVRKLQKASSKKVS